MQRFLATKPGKHGAPKRTAGELADEFGLTAGVLVRLMNADPDGPRATLDNRQISSTHRLVWYDPATVRAWWARRAQSVPSA